MMERVGRVGGERWIPGEKTRKGKEMGKEQVKGRRWERNK